MKTLLTKLLAAMLVACLLLTPVAMMEEAPVADAADAEVTVTASTDDAVPEAPADDDVEITPDAVDEAVPEEGASELDNTVLFEAGEVELDLGDDLTEDSLLFADEVTYSIDDEFDDPVLRGMVKGSLHISFTAPNATATSTQLAGVTSLTLPGLKSLKGIQLLTGLEDLHISGASLTSINLKNTAVQCISIGNCSNLKELDLSGCTNLRSLDCINNKLETLNVDDCPALVDLTCLGNRLKTLNVSTNTRLEKLNCNDNQLEILNVSNNPDLQELDCAYNGLASLNLEKNTKLKELHCQSNKGLSTLDISNCAFAATIASSAQELIALDIDEPDVLYACYAPYSWNDEEQGASGSYWYLTCDKDVTLITQKEEKKEDKKEDTPPPAASTPAAAVTTPAAPAAPVIIAKVPASAKAKAGKKGKVTVSWKNIRKSKKTKALLKQIKGIEVQYSTDPNFATDVNTRTLGKKKTRLTLKLQKKTTYYVRVRYLDGAGGVSDWSAIRQVKTKK